MPPITLRLKAFHAQTGSLQPTWRRSSRRRRWPRRAGATLGHQLSVPLPLTIVNQTYRDVYLAFGQPGNAPSPVYENAPADPVIKFRQTLAKAWGRYYTFRYRGGLPPGGRGSPSSPTASRSAVTRGR
jgi:hypothetical protein